MLESKPQVEEISITWQSVLVKTEKNANFITKKTSNAIKQKIDTYKLDFLK